MLVGVIADFLLEQDLQLGGEPFPGAEIDGDIHQVDRLVKRHNAWGAEQDVLGDLGKTKIPVDGRTDIVGGVDGAFLQGREDIRAGQGHGAGTQGLEGLGDHAARCPDFHPFEIFQGVNRLFRVDDIGVMVDLTDIEQAVLLIDLAGELFHAEGVEHDIPLPRLIRSHRIRGKKNRCRNLAGPVQGERLHTLENTGRNGFEQRVVVGGN